MIQKEFRIQSFEKTQTLTQDIDQGVIRVSGASLGELGGRNSLVRVSVIEDGCVKKSIVRIVRAATGEGALTNEQVAMQYDDRVNLGIQNVGTTVDLKIEPVNEWLGLPQFLLGHSSPLNRCSKNSIK